MRMLAITAPQRLSAELSVVPTWWRAGVGARKYRWHNDYRGSAATSKFLAQEYQILEALLAQLGHST